MTAAGVPPLDRYYEWLLSDAPAAQRERQRRREASRLAAYEQRRLVMVWSKRILSDPKAPSNLQELAEIVGRMAQRQQDRAALDDAEPTHLWLVRARRKLESSRQAAGDYNYRYPQCYLGQAAADQPVPDEPVPAGSVRAGDRVRLNATGLRVTVRTVSTAGEQVVITTNDGHRTSHDATSDLMRVHDLRYMPETSHRSSCRRQDRPGHENGLHR